MDIEKLYHSIKGSLTGRRLTEISQGIIGAYRSGNHGLLTAMNRSISADSAPVREAHNKTFLKLIKYFHPDRLESLSSDIDRAFEAGDLKRLFFYQNLLSADRKAKKLLEERYRADYSESFAYSDDRTVYSAFAMHESGFNDSLSERDMDFDFLDAVKSELFGNLDFEISVHDLEQMEDELVLRGYGLTDLSGLEYCSNITILDLSYNRINSIYEISDLGYLTELYLSGNMISDLDPLSGLENLEILDLSRNDIEDIEPLPALPNLRFLDIRFNPVSDLGIEKLKDRGVVVLR